MASLPSNSRSPQFLPSCMIPCNSLVLLLYLHCSVAAAALVFWTAALRLMRFLQGAAVRGSRACCIQGSVSASGKVRPANQRQAVNHPNVVVVCVCESPCVFMISVVVVWGSEASKMPVFISSSGDEPQQKLQQAFVAFTDACDKAQLQLVPSQLSLLPISDPNTDFCPS